MTDTDPNEQTKLEAGEFSTWLSQVMEAIRNQGNSDVPCDGCTACCRSSQFINIGPDETDTVAHIPSEVLFPAPLMPHGHLLLGYDERGHCPMLVDNRCSIYEHRPKACRSYDCRIFPATGIAPGGEKPLVDQRAERWQFAYLSEADRLEQAAVEAATAFLREHAADLPPGTAPNNSTQAAVLALQIHGLFLRTDEETGQMAIATPDLGTFQAEVLRVTPKRPEARSRNRKPR